MKKNKLTAEQNTSSACITGLIAVVGSDGTGKSTLTADLVKNLQQHRPTERRYLGLISGEDGDKIKKLPFIGVWLERRLAAKSDKTQRMSNRPPALWAALIMYGFSLWRASNLRKVRRLAQSGVERAKGWLLSRLAARERRLYQRMAVYRPELIIRLDIDVDTAFSRKPDHSYEELEDKISAMVRLQYNGARIIELDARAPYDEVLSNALNAISAVVNPAKRPQSDIGQPGENAGEETQVY